MKPAYRIGQWVWNSVPKHFTRDIRNLMRIAEIEKTDTHYRLHLTNRHANVITGWKRLFVLLMLISLPAHAEKETVTVHVTAHVVGMVCTLDSPLEECQDAAVVAKLAEGDTVIVNNEGER